LSTAEELFMTYGLKSISMDDISRKLGISKKTIYQYNEKKSHLIKKVLQNYLSKDQKKTLQIIENSEDAIDEYLSIARHIISNIRMMKPTIIYDLKKYYPESWLLIETDHFNFIRKVIVKNINRGVFEGLYRKDANAEIISKLYVGSSTTLADESIFPLQKFSKDQLFIELAKYHLHGIASEKGLKRMSDMIKEKI